MNNLIKFINAFAEYFIVFIIFIAAIIIGSIIGVTLRKRKNVKEAELAAQDDKNEAI